jgi:transcriptional regulator with XRE-family HTH domain
MEMMKVFVFNMKKYRKKRQISQMRLAEMLNTSTSYIGEIEINSRVPSMDMVERIAKALNIEPFRLFVDDKTRPGGNTPTADDYLECLSSTERQDLAQRIIALISNDVEQMLQPEADNNIPPNRRKSRKTHHKINL